MECRFSVSLISLARLLDQGRGATLKEKVEGKDKEQKRCEEEVK